MRNPQCCQYAKDYITSHYYRAVEKESVEMFKKNPPFWLVRGAESNWRESGEICNTPPNINFCPSCGTSMPKLKLKATLPKKIMIITDGGYYCNTCNKRLDSCTCERPEEMWEVDNGE